MAIVEWSEDYSVNVNELDNQHKKLFELIDQLVTAMHARKAKEIMADIIKGLAEYTVSHFKKEENYFALYNYPDAIAHKKEHDSFIEKVNQFKSDVEAGKLFVAIDVQRFLLDWLTSHIKTVDKKYSEFFNNKGLK